MKKKEIKRVVEVNTDSPAPAEEREHPRKRAKARRTAKAVAGGLTAAVVVGAIAGLSVALVYSENMNKLRAEYMNEMEGVYARNYYDLLDSANDLDVKLAKLAAANTAAAQREILYDVWSAASLAGVSLSAFEGGEDGVMQASKFIGQTGDYAHYLAESLEDGEPLNAEEREKLSKLREMAGVLKDTLESTRTGMSDGRLFLGDDGMLETFTGAFDAFVDPDVDYPELIYDGPFSDALEHRECKATEGMSEVSAEEGAELVAKYIPAAKKVEFYDRTESDVVTLNYAVTTDEGEGFAQITEQGGLLVAYNLNPGKVAVSDSFPQHCAAALKFAAGAGYEDLAVVWCSEAQGTVFVNLAPVACGAVIYPDLIKVKVDAASGTVTGLDALHYIYNHTEREIPAPALTLAEAAQRITLPLVTEGRLALIPLDETREVLTYEFECEDCGTYFVYIDAMTGEEANILYVVSDTDTGTALM